MSSQLDFAAIGVRVDTVEVEKGKSNLDSFTASAVKAETAIENLKPASAGAGQAVREIADGAAKTAPALDRSNTSMQAATITARQYSQAMRLVPAQITDIVTQLAGGQSPFLIAIQQGGQLRDSFGGVGETLRALSSIITPTRIAIGASVGAAALLAKAFNEGQREGFEFAKAIELSGNAAGVTRGELAEMARSVDEFVGTQASAAAVLAQLAGSGRVAAEDLELFTIVAQDLKRTAGTPIEETVKAFTELGRRPVEASLKLNESFNYLTAGTYRLLKALEDQGRISEAGEVAQKLYAAAAADRMKRLDQDLGTLQRIARGTSEVFSEMWDAILNVGRPSSIDQQIADVQRLIREFSSGAARLEDDDGFGGVVGGRERRVAALRQELKALQDVKVAQHEEAQADAERAKAFRDYLAQEKESLALGEARKTQLEALSKAGLSAAIGDIQRSQRASLSGFSAYTAQLEALRSADLIGDREYYAARRALVDKDTAIRIKALRDESSRVGGEINRLQEARTDAGRDKTESERIKAEAPFLREVLQLKERRKDIEADIAEIQIAAASQSAILSKEEEAGIRAVDRALQDARTSADAYLKTLAAQNDRRLAGFALGDRAREAIDARNDIDDRFAQQRLDLDRDRQNEKITEESYRKRLQIIEESNGKALQEVDRYYSALEEKEGSFFAGASQAYATYLEDSRNVAEQSRRAFENAFDGAEDALIGFVQTGKLDFKSLADSVIADLLRIQLKAAVMNLASLNWGGFLSGLFGAFTPSGGIGAGGGTAPSGGVRVAAAGESYVPRDNMPYLLHKGEAVVPASMNPFAGGRWPGGKGISFGDTYINAGPGTSIAQIDALVQARFSEFEGRIAENLSRGRWDSYVTS